MLVTTQAMAILVDVTEDVVKALTAYDIFVAPTGNPLSRFAPILYPAIQITDILPGASNS